MLHCRWAHPTATCSWDSTVPSSLIPTNSLPSWYFPLHQHWHNNCLPSKPNKQKKKMFYGFCSLFSSLGKPQRAQRQGKEKLVPFTGYLICLMVPKSLLYMALWKKIHSLLVLRSVRNWPRALIHSSWHYCPITLSPASSLALESARAPGCSANKLYL